MNDNRTGSSPRRFTLATSILLGLLIVVGLASWLYVAIKAAREAAIASASQGPLNQLSVALHNYHEAFGCLPPAYVADADGTPLHSWRALVLPYVDGAELYKQYRFDEPWNGPNNIRLADRMPSIFHCPSEPESTRFANYVVIAGPQTAFPGANCTRFEQFEDGLNETILVAEIADSDIVWLEPRDLDVDTMSFDVNHKHQPSISSNRNKGPYVVFADTIHAYWLGSSLSTGALRALTTVNGDEAMSLVELDGAGLFSLSEGPASDANLSQLAHGESFTGVWLSRSPITDRGLAPLGRIESLSHLSLAGTQITDDGLKHIANMTYYSLDLRNTHITDAAIPQLRTVQTVHRLDVSGTDITDENFTNLEHVTARHLERSKPDNGVPESDGVDSD